MFKVIEKVCNHPIRFFAKPGVKLIPGYVAAIVEYNGDLVCDIWSPGKNPFGIIGTKMFIRDDNVSYNKKLMVSVWPQRMIFRTDHMDSSVKYGPGDKLYAGVDGMLTNKPLHDGDVFLARLTAFPDNERNYFEALWV